jgi:hypothetical protein
MSEQYIIYFHLQRNGLFLCRDKEFREIDSPLLCRWENIDVAAKYIEDKDIDKIKCTLWIIGSKELKEWLDATKP